MAMDLAVLANDPGALELAADPGQFVVLACERAKQWLTEALNNGEIDQLVELKSQAEAIRIYSAQKQIGKDAELAAAEIVNRAIRGIASAVRRGQEAGEIKVAREGNGRPSEIASPGDAISKPKALDYFGSQKERTDGFVMAAAPDDFFEDALAEAKAEKDLSRANVVRKVKGETKSGPKNEWHRKRHNLDPNRIIRETILAADGAAAGLRLIDWDGVEIEDWWVESLTASLTQLRRLCNHLKERT